MTRFSAIPAVKADKKAATGRAMVMMGSVRRCSLGRPWSRSMGACTVPWTMPANADLSSAQIRSDLVRILGTDTRMGTLVTSRRSSALSKELFIISTRKTAPPATARTNIKPMNIIRCRLGPSGDVGWTAGSMRFAFPIRFAPPTGSPPSTITRKAPLPFTVSIHPGVTPTLPPLPTEDPSPSMPQR